MVKKPVKAQKAASKAPEKAPRTAAKSTAKPAAKPSQQPEWLQDVSIEAPVPGTFAFAPGQRQLEFSVGMRQMEESDHIRSELRARAVIHAENIVLTLIEASYVNIAPKHEIRENLPEYLYSQLKPQMEHLLTLTGHTPPLPESLEKVAG